MSLLPRQTDSELARIAEERWARRRGLVVIPTVAELALPVTIVLPWSYLVSDNAKFAVGGGSHPRLVHSAIYRGAMKKIAALARAVVGDARAVEFPLLLHARVFVPDNRPRDVGNFRKLVTDSLQSTIFVNDKQLWCEVWERVGVCVDSPRAEVTISDMGLR